VGCTEALGVAWIDGGIARDRIRMLMIESFAPVIAAWPRDRRAAARRGGTTPCGDRPLHSS
jgi:hypothetical protein